MEKFHEFCEAVKIEEHLQAEQAALFVYFHCKFTGDSEIRMEKLRTQFVEAQLPQTNMSRLKDDALAKRKLIKGEGLQSFRLPREKWKEYDGKFGHIFKAPVAPKPTVVERADIDKAPRLTADEVEMARKMAELYVITHCYENSVRKVIGEVLSSKFGQNWFELAANNSIKNTVQQRRDKEARNKWITPRGATPLYYVDWGDLLSLMSKHQQDFEAIIPDYDFVRTRFEELECIRNIIAHHGSLPSTDEADHIILSLKQWCKQLG
jgi:hypothetical protein